MTQEESRPINLAEYAALRSEITTFLALQVQFINYSVVLGSAIAGLFIKNPTFDVAAFFPLPFLIFGLLYGDAKARILRAAHYIHVKLRPTLIDPAHEPLLRWEIFIREEPDLKLVLSVGEKLRWALFLLPLAVSIIYLILGKPVPPQHGPLVGFLFTVDFILFVLFLWTARELDKYEKDLLHEK